jgi:hypothetical protein
MTAMDSVHIGELRARYRLPTGGQVARRRLDAVLRRVLDEALEPALARAGIVLDEEVCVREIDAPVRLLLSAPDVSLVEAWSLALTDALQRALAAGRGVARYRTRTHALLEMLTAVARLDYERAWAWRQLGLWQAGDQPGDAAAMHEAVQALAHEPQAVVPVLREAGRLGIPARLGDRLADEDWIILARSALAAAGIPPGLAAPEADAVAAVTGSSATSDSSPSAASSAARLIQASAFAVGLAPVARSGAARALAVLVVLDAEPAALRGSQARSRALLAAVTAALVAPAARVDAAERVDADFSAAPDSAEPRAEEAGAANTIARRRDPALEGADSLTSAAAPTSPGPGGALLAPRRAPTAAGGLLFFLHLVDELGLPEEITTSEPLAARGVRWTLHRLAVELAVLEATDPAALAFAGLRPDSEPPSLGQDRPGDDERAALARLASRLAVRLHERLADVDVTADAQLDWVLRRDAEIVADPGWIEVRLPLEQVSTQIRRVGLDLDPGYVPWLGVVVRFVYA